MPPTYSIRPIEARDDAAIAAVIRSVMPEFGAGGAGFAIHDTEVDAMSAAYARPRKAGMKYILRSSQVPSSAPSSGATPPPPSTLPPASTTK